MISAFSDILPVYSSSKLKLTHNLSFYHNACLKRDETCWCVQLLKLLSQNVSIMFDCEKVLGEFDYRTESKSIERSEFNWVRLPTFD